MATSSIIDSAQFQRPTPLPFHRALVSYLKTEETDLWNWFSSTRTRNEHVESTRLELLKTTYRLEPAEQPKLYALAEEIMQRYGVTAPVTFYQAQGGGGLNAALAYLPGEIHIILSGPVAAVLAEGELKAMLGHELAHFIFFEEWDRQFLIATDLLHALANDAAAAPAHLESSRLFRLYTEIFADRGAYFLTEDVNPAISVLLKLETGLEDVSPESYLRQAEEIFKKSQAHTDGLSHPEAYIRARALKLWAEQGDAALTEIERMIEGPLALDRLGLLAQQKGAAITRRLLERLLGPSWFRSESVLAHARLYFGDFTPGPGAVDEQALADEIEQADAAFQKYLCYVLLDFVTVDRELSDTALPAVLLLSRRLDLDKLFTDIAMKELGIGKKQFAKMDREAEEIVTKASKEAAGNS